MTSVVRTLAGFLVLALPAAALAGILVGRRPGRLATAIRLGIVAALPGLVALVWLASRHGDRPLVRVTVLLAALVPGYALGGWLAVRSEPAGPTVTAGALDDTEGTDTETDAESGTGGRNPSRLDA